LRDYIGRMASRQRLRRSMRTDSQTTCTIGIQSCLSTQRKLQCGREASYGQREHVGTA
jgi:hypothetical protein